MMNAREDAVWVADTIERLRDELDMLVADNERLLDALALLHDMLPQGTEERGIVAAALWPRERGV
jgi:hypothetical protein